MFPSQLTRLMLLLLTTGAVLASLLVGCGKQDLYEPPGSPYAIVGSLPLPSVNEGVAVIEHTAFVAGGQAGLHSIDISNPAEPQLLQTYNTLKYAQAVEVVRTFADATLRDIAHVVEGTEGVTSYEVTDPTAIHDFETTTTAINGRRIFIDESEDPSESYVVYLAESWKGVRIFESVPGDPGILAYNGVFAGTQGYAEGIAVKDGYAYVADDELGLAVLDVRILELDAVQLVGWADSPGNARDVAVQGNYAFVADGSEGLAVFRIDGGEDPVYLASRDLGGYCRSITVRDEIAVLAAGGAGAHFVNISDPGAPIYLGTVVTSYAMEVVLADDGYCLIADQQDGLVILSGHGPFSDRRAPGRVPNLGFTTLSTSTLRASWYMTGDDGMVGRAAAVDLRYSDQPITEENWNEAIVVSGLPETAAPGDNMSMDIGGLDPGTIYYCALKVSDEQDQESPLSNVASAVTEVGLTLSDGSVDIIAGTVDDTDTYTVTYRFDVAPTVHQIVIDGEHLDMAEDSGKDVETVYSYQTTLAMGEHSYAFYFEAPGSASVLTEAFAGPFVGINFTMGSVVGEPGRDNDESQHIVTLVRPLIAGETEVTNADWDLLMPVNPSVYTDGDLPVNKVAWLDAVRYCNALSADQGLTAAYTIDINDQVDWDRDADGWRLPTEAEWEWLCRAETTTPFYAGEITALVCNHDTVLDAIGWYCGNAGNGPHSVGEKDPNALDIHDMSGNVWEWCWDWYEADLGSDPVFDPIGPDSGARRVVRGGSWYYASEDCRSASRGAYFPGEPDDVIGLRVVRTDSGN